MWSVAGLVAAGAGVTVVPALVGPLTAFADTVLIELVEPVVTRDTWVIRDPLRPLSPAAAGLLDVITHAQRRGLALPTGCEWSA
ncbi:putative LysR family transcriptional regulator [Kineosphaera limosa NBRC 100340]|uniref:Putative LysR family transcriptional regulator n=1 Tax=Kineosphaera limosa NBRC 100340 TaxID=1184609 RepID=K6X9F7_9MICO|nr:putative LysR family transcriptional regulator [Kineosphaera limosa NBRC 100340]